MLNINFVPDDYVKNTQFTRINILYLALLAVVIAALAAAFVAIKISQRAVNAKEKLVNQKMEHAQEAIQKFEQLQAKRKTMMTTALTTAALIEPVPRSVILASLTNNLPLGASLLEVKMLQKQPQESKQTQQPKSKYEKKTKSDQKQIQSVLQSPEKDLETKIDIEGIAPSDLEVAAYIENLTNSNLITKVSLVESKEYNEKNTKNDQTKEPSRRFKLNAILEKDVILTKDCVQKIAAANKPTEKF